MKKIEKVIYIADDGTEFDDEHKCRGYEESTKVRSHMSEISKYCSERECANCTFYDDGCFFSHSSRTPLDWELFMW